MSLLNRLDFNTCCLKIKQIGEEIGEYWSWLDFKHNTEQKYLTKTSNLALKLSKSNFNTPNDVEVEVTPTDLSEEDELVVEVSHKEMVRFEHHVVYSDSYSVPVLYFNAYYQDGTQLSLQEIWNLITDDYQHALQDKWSFLTQQEHPYLQRPFFQLHPCHTETMLKTLLSSQGDCYENNSHNHPGCGNIVLMWLSAVAPIAQLKLSMHYFQQQFKQIEKEI